MEKLNNSMKTYLNNLGIINALGASKAVVAKNLLSNNQQGMVKTAPLCTGRTSRAGVVTAPLIEIPKQLANYNCRNNQLLATAYAEIADDVETLKERYGAHRITVVLGTSTSGIASGEAALKKFLETGAFPATFDYIQQEIGATSEFLSQYANITGPHYTISTACSSSGKAFASAQRLLEADLADAVIVGGSDSLCELTLNGFDSLELLSADYCNPFSKNRSGINIGEGAALFLLTKEKSEIAFIAAGESSDGHHMTAPDPTGRGAMLAIEDALKQANLDVDQIGYINLHGTGTQKNDEMESIAIDTLFKNKPPCSSTKPLIGHTLGAAAAQELGFCWLLLSSQYNPNQNLPAQLWDQQLDPALPELNFTKENSRWEKPYFLSTSFAFGGSNVCLIIEKTA